MYSSDEIIESIEVNISDSFCHFTKAKGTSGNGEAKLFIKGFQRLHEIKTFFSNLYSSLSSPSVFLKYSIALLVLSFIELTYID